MEHYRLSFEQLMRTTDRYTNEEIEVFSESLLHINQSDVASRKFKECMDAHHINPDSPSFQKDFPDMVEDFLDYEYTIRKTLTRNLSKTYQSLQKLEDNYLLFQTFPLSKEKSESLRGMIVVAKEKHLKDFCIGYSCASLHILSTYLYEHYKPCRLSIDNSSVRHSLSQLAFTPTDTIHGGGYNFLTNLIDLVKAYNLGVDTFSENHRQKRKENAK